MRKRKAKKKPPPDAWARAAILAAAAHMAEVLERQVSTGSEQPFRTTDTF